MTQIADIELHRLPSRTNMFSNLFNFQNKQKDGNNEGGGGTSSGGGKTETKSKLSLGFKNKDKSKKQQPQPETRVQQQPVQVSPFLSNVLIFCLLRVRKQMSARSWPVTCAPITIIPCLSHF